MAKGTRVTQREKEKMWQLFQEGNSFVKIGKKMRRSPDTVSRYVHEYEAAVSAAGYILNNKQ
jgi:IS30 family transposase